MSQYKEMFEKFRQGNLDEKGIDELNRILVEIYFISPAALSQTELEYTEDLVIELSLTGRLEKSYSSQLKAVFDTNKTFVRKYNLYRDLREANETALNNKLAAQINTGETEAEKEEELQLSGILHEVIERVHAEENESTVRAKAELFLYKLGKFLRKLVPEIVLEQPRLRTALIFTSVILIAGIVWISVRQNDNQMANRDTITDSIRNQSDSTTDKDQQNLIEPLKKINKPDYAFVDSVRNKQLIPEHLAENQKDISFQDSLLKEMDMVLLACADDIPSEIEYMELRSATSTAQELFISAAKKYESGDFDNCAILLKGLLASKEFKSPDTLSEINFFLGIIHMKKGFRNNNSKSFKLAVKYLNAVDPGTRYFNDALWYRALTELKLGNRTKGKSILETLLKNKYLRSGEVQKLRDMVGNAM